MGISSIPTQRAATTWNGMEQWKSCCSRSRKDLTVDQRAGSKHLFFGQTSGIFDPPLCAWTKRPACRRIVVADMWGLWKMARPNRTGPV